MQLLSARQTLSACEPARRGNGTREAVVFVQMRRHRRRQAGGDGTDAEQVAVLRFDGRDAGCPPSHTIPYQTDAASLVLLRRSSSTRRALAVKRSADAIDRPQCEGGDNGHWRWNNRRKKLRA